MIKAIRNRVLVKKHQSAEATPGGILIPDLVRDRPIIADVLDVGPGMLSPKGVFINTELKVGQTVVIPKYGGTLVKYKNEEYTLLREDEVLGVLESGENQD